MLHCLVHEGAYDGLEVGLEGAVVGSIDVRNLHSIQDRFENGRAHGAGHTGERKNVNDSIKSMQTVLEGAADAQACFRAHVKREEAVIIELFFDLVDPVVPMDGQVLLNPSVNLVQADVLVRQFRAVAEPIFKVLSKSLEITLPERVNDFSSRPLHVVV